MAASKFRFDAFNQSERRVIADALTRHADALEAFYADAAAGDGVEAERLLQDAILARTLHAGFAA